MRRVEASGLRRARGSKGGESLEVGLMMVESCSGSPKPKQLYVATPELQ